MWLNACNNKLIDRQINMNASIIYTIVSQQFIKVNFNMILRFSWEQYNYNYNSFNFTLNDKTIRNHDFHQW